MDRTVILEALGQLDDRYIESAAAYSAKKVIPLRGKRKAVIALLAAAMALLLMGAAVIAAARGDLWMQIPSKDPAETVRTALENQEGKDYTLAIEVKRVEVDPAETEKVVERFIKGVIAERQGWSDDYLQQHFIVVKAEYYAEYDHEKTTRSDGDVVQYFYLTRDEKTMRWSIVDNSGNVNWSEDPGTAGTEATIEEQIFLYLSNRFTEAFAPYYDGLRYEIRGYKEAVSEGKVTADIWWTMYHLGKGWDVSSDEGVEWDANMHLQLTAELREDGSLDPETIVVLGNSNPIGPPSFDTPLEEYFPDQLNQ
ncbi:MAG: hypothetical protein E7223_07775 [Clostridiales bacterium]|nr:hypothetical protein [Clostridiales bacterium]